MDAAILILAAGESKRMGEPKLLLRFNGTSLLQRAINTALATGALDTVVITGAYHKEITESLDEPIVTVLYNEHWASGMASSIRCGIRYIMTRNPGIPAVLVMVADQPFLTPAILNNLYQIYTARNAPVAACSYAGLLGTPAIFHKSNYHNLLLLEGDKGAKSIMEKRRNDIAILDFPEGAVDIDTPLDYKKLDTVNHE